MREYHAIVACEGARVYGSSQSVSDKEEVDGANKNALVIGIALLIVSAEVPSQDER